MRVPSGWMRDVEGHVGLEGSHPGEVGGLVEQGGVVGAVVEIDVGGGATASNLIGMMPMSCR